MEATSHLLETSVLISLCSLHHNCLSTLIPNLPLLCHIEAALRCSGPSLSSHQNHSQDYQGAPLKASCALLTSPPECFLYAVTVVSILTVTCEALHAETSYHPLSPLLILTLYTAGLGYSYPHSSCSLTLISDSMSFSRRLNLHHPIP